MNKFVLLAGTLVIFVILLSVVGLKAEDVIIRTSSREEGSTLNKDKKKEMAAKVG